jgi:hypothetical protein
MERMKALSLGSFNVKDAYNIVAMELEIRGLLQRQTLKTIIAELLHE